MRPELPFGLTWGHVEALKWVGIVSMLVDHTDAYIFGRGLSGGVEFGRLAFPLFGLALGIGIVATKDRGGLAWRLLLFGAAAHVARLPMRDEFQGNVLWSFFLAVCAFEALRLARSNVIAGALMLAACVFASYWCEFGPAGLTFVLAIALYSERPSCARLLVVLSTLALLWFSNESLWAFAAVPAVFLVRHFDIQGSRSGRFFYWFYPAHLAIFSSIRLIFV